MKRAVVYTKDKLLASSGKIVHRGHPADSLKKFAAENDTEPVAWFEDYTPEENPLNKTGVQSLLRAFLKKRGCRHADWNQPQGCGTLLSSGVGAARSRCLFCRSLFFGCRFSTWPLACIGAGSVKICFSGCSRTPNDFVGIIETPG
jgi:hypothetical protein